MKVCPKCGVNKEDSEFRKTFNKKVNKYYLSPYCKPCAVEYNRDRYHGGRKPNHAKLTDTHKECMSCKEMLPHSNFNKIGKAKHGLGAYCKKCFKEKYYDKEKSRKQTAKYRAAHPEKWRAMHRVHQYNRRALINATDDGTVTEEFLKELLDKSTCCWCGKETPASERTIEHIIELSNGGLHSASNLDMSCFSCNSSRPNKGVKPNGD